MDNVKSLPKQKLINFLKNGKLEEDYSFEVAIPIEEALNFVHRMRVELSRFREKVRQKKRIPKHFKMLYIKAEAAGEGKCNITLRRSLSGHDVSNEIDEIFNDIAGGQLINAGKNING